MECGFQSGEGNGKRKQKGNREMELLVGLVVMGIVWVIVIYGSELVNRNVQ
jgi:hypothetical protein